MDIASLATAAMAVRSEAKAQAIAVKIIKDNAASEQAVADLLTASQENLDTLTRNLSEPGRVVDVTV